MNDRPELIRPNTGLRLEPTSYKSLRQHILRRDGWRCQFCGAMSNLEVHRQRVPQPFWTRCRGKLDSRCARHATRERIGATQDLNFLRQSEHDRLRFTPAEAEVSLQFGNKLNADGGVVSGTFGIVLLAVRVDAPPTQPACLPNTPPLFSRDLKSYVFTYERITSDLYVVDGLK